MTTVKGNDMKKALMAIFMGGMAATCVGSAIQASSGLLLTTLLLCAAFIYAIYFARAFKTLIE